MKGSDGVAQAGPATTGIPAVACSRPKLKRTDDRSWSRLFNTLQCRVVVLLLMILIPFVILNGILYHSTLENQRATGLRDKLDLAWALAGSFNEFLKDVLYHEQIIGTRVGRPNISNQERQRLLEAGKIQLRIVPEVRWVDTGGRIAASTELTAIGAQVNDLRFFRDISPLKNWAISSEIITESGKEPFVHVSQGILDENGSLGGIVVTSLNQEQLDKILSANGTSGVAVALLDAEGNVVYSHPKMGGFWNEHEWAGRYPHLKRDMGNVEIVATVSGADRRAHLTALAPVSGTDWAIGASFPEDDALAATISTIWRDAELFIIVGILAFAVALFQSRKIIAPLQTLRRFSQAVARGETVGRIELRGPVELQDLAGSFNYMKNEILAREKALQRAQDRLEAQVQKRTLALNATLEKLRSEAAERKDAEEKTSRAKALLQSVFNGIAEPLLMLDDNLRVIIINEAGCKYYGIGSCEVAVGKTCYEAFKGRSSPCENCRIPSSVSTGECTTFERGGLFAPDRVEQVAVYPMRRKGNGLSGAIVRISDITETKSIEKQLMRADRLSSLGQLSGGIAHEIRNPLAGINLLIDVLDDEDKFVRTEQELEILGEIKGSIKRIDVIIKKVLDFAKSSDSTLSRVGLKPLIQDTVKLWQSKIRNTGIRLSLSLPDDIPEVMGDAIEIQQVLHNLVQNAVEAVPPEGTIEINLLSGELSFGRNRPAVIIEVIDSGAGIPEDQENSIFNPFFTTKPTGTGLGLSICHQIVARHGGIILFNSKPGAGTMFRVELPAAQRS
jgi:signal transduction histidine kinase